MSRARYIFAAPFLCCSCPIKTKAMDRDAAMYGLADLIAIWDQIYVCPGE